MVSNWLPTPLTVKCSSEWESVVGISLLTNTPEAGVTVKYPFSLKTVLGSPGFKLRVFYEVTDITEEHPATDTHPLRCWQQSRNGENVCAVF